MARAYSRDGKRYWNRAASKDRALMILANVSKETKIDRKSLTQPARFKHIVKARVKFMKRCEDARIPIWVIAEVLNHDHTTVYYWLRPNMRGRKMALGKVEYAGRYPGGMQ